MVAESNADGGRVSDSDRRRTDRTGLCDCVADEFDTGISRHHEYFPDADVAGFRSFFSGRRFRLVVLVDPHQSINLWSRRLAAPVV